jgi:hypothetical protein
VTDEVDTGSGIPKRFRDLSADVREERLVRYVVKQLGLDRHMDDIMKDEEVVAHSSEVTRTDLTTPLLAERRVPHLDRLPYLRVRQHR